MAYFSFTVFEAVLMSLAAGIVIWLGLIFAIPAIIVGQALCLLTPQAIGGSGKIRLALLLQVAAIGLTFMNGIIISGFSESVMTRPILHAIGPTGTDIINVAPNLLHVGSALYFLSFIKGIAVHIERKDLARSTANVMAWVITVALTLALPLLSKPFSLTQQVEVVAFGIFGLAMLIVLLLTFIRGTKLVGQMARAIPEYNLSLGNQAVTEEEAQD